MKDHITALTEAVRLARIELASHEEGRIHGPAASVIRRLNTILNDASVDEAMAAFNPEDESPSIVPNINTPVIAKH